LVRIAVVGNAGGGKSTLARAIAACRGLPHVEIDSLLWQEGWKLTRVEIYMRRHAELIAGDAWVIDGLGHQASMAGRFERATEIVLIDMPLWIHFWLAAERQIAWAQGRLDHKPGGVTTMPPTKELFRAIWEVDQDWMPDLRALYDEAERRGKIVTRLASVEDIDAFTQALQPSTKANPCPQ
jgi:adenylate kinase family enzyme